MAKGGMVVHLQKDRQVEKLGQRYHSVVLLLLKGGMVLLPLRYDGGRGKVSPSGMMGKGKSEVNGQRWHGIIAPQVRRGRGKVTSMVTGSIWYCPSGMMGKGKREVNQVKGGMVVHLWKDR